MKKKLPRVAILFSGVGSNMAYMLEHMHGKELEVVLAVTNNPQARGIGIALSYNIPCKTIDPKIYESREAYDEMLVKKLQVYQPDLAVLAGFMRILTPVFTDRIRAINLHPSLLPRHKDSRLLKKVMTMNFPLVAQACIG